MELPILIFAGEDETAAFNLMREFRECRQPAEVLSAFVYQGDSETLQRPERSAASCKQAIVMPDVPDFVYERISSGFPGKVEPRRKPIEETPPQPRRRGRPRKVAA